MHVCMSASLESVCRFDGSIFSVTDKPDKTELADVSRPIEKSTGESSKRTNKLVFSIVYAMFPGTTNQK